MFVMLRVRNVGANVTMDIAVNPLKVEYVRPAYMEEDCCYISLTDTNFRIEESFEAVVDKLQKAKESK